ncbi:MAG: hypothetical protein N2235_14855 [Fischerella sp.]|nr:hypothetical protein [Fischerella sp.]
MMRHPFHSEAAEIKATSLIFEELSNDESQKVAGGFSFDFPISSNWILNLFGKSQTEAIPKGEVTSYETPDGKLRTYTKRYYNREVEKI